ncbi:TPA: hypothetical protein SBJ50_004333 [Yersinia enterocolitica]|nr:hypothetical protein [Yersinia enterocolitica]ELI7979512.1 hypothetical protein [Yersinia enterocolitica]ELI9226505.1 hypothetical protein [Yersinia enterocolitica]ELW7370101.1 hypothetical protein [Yersinia enterocolitica]ELY5234549.1 hypothetical protein [Yersinia enterocolitica]
MKKHEILYDWPIQEINRLTNSDVAENYAEELEELDLNKFVTLTERIRILGSELEQTKVDRVHFSKWAELRTCAEEFSGQFDSFPSPSIEKLKLSALLAGKLSESLPPLDETDIDTNMFELRELTQPIPQLWFCRENSLSIADSVILFSCDKLSVLSSEITSSIISPNLLFYFMAALHIIDDLPPTHAILVKKMTPQVEEPAINAFARLVVLATGKPVHSSRKYTKTPYILNPDEIQLGEAYHQWSEVLNVLSEYNSRDETLLKFLTIYHVIENFMFKRPIVELERQMNGQMFSIRDFRRLYASVDINESDALKKVFCNILMMEAIPGITFQDDLISRWRSLLLVTSEADINTALKMIGLKFSFTDFNRNSVLSCFSKLVYTIRNAIVHNKETEFHLTYAPLDMNPSLCYLIEDFLLPSLEGICFSLISKNNVHFWYQNKEMNLYM